jgi:protein SCO1/2
MEKYMAILGQKIAHHRERICENIIYGLCFIFLFSCNNKENKLQHLPYYNTADFTPIWADEQKVNIDTLHTISQFAFTDQENKIISNTTFKDKIYVANFFFTACPGICPKMTSNLETVAKAFKNDPDILFISHSVTPEKDSVPVLKSYAGFHGINSKQWHLVTGDLEEINTLARKSYFIEKLPGLSANGTDFLHTENLVLIDRKGHIRGLYKGTLELDAQKLIEEITLLKKE